MIAELRTERRLRTDGHRALHTYCALRTGLQNCVAAPVVVVVA